MWLTVEQSVLTLPASTQPISVSNAVGDPGSLTHWPLGNTLMKMSTPSSKFTLLVQPNSGSANGMPDKCFHLESSCTDLRGKLVVTRGTITAVIGISLDIVLVGDMIKVLVDCTELPWASPATPWIVAYC